MNTPHDSFEDELRALRAADPSLRLASRIAADLAAPPTAPAPAAMRRTATRAVMLWLPWGVAAAMTVAFLTHRPAATTAQAPTPATETATAAPSLAQDALPRFTPVSTTKTLVGALDEGVVFLEDGRPARKLRYEFVDTVDLLSTDASRAMIAVSTPREEIRLVPVQTY